MRGWSSQGAEDQCPFEMAAPAWLETVEMHIDQERWVGAVEVLQRNENSLDRLAVAHLPRLIAAARKLWAEAEGLRPGYRSDARKIARSAYRRWTEAQRMKRTDATRKAEERKLKAHARRQRVAEERRADELRIQNATASTKARYESYLAAGLRTRRAWTLALMPEGPYGVSITGMARGWLERSVAECLATDLGFGPKEAALLVERAVHIAPESVAFDVDQSSAVRLKKALESRGARIRVDMASRRESSERRPSIPQAVRHEVWRRDGGRCVDCGSAENLHFDHIIPWSRGGANTPRNLELRCEPCNLSKGARIRRCGVRAPRGEKC